MHIEMAGRKAILGLRRLSIKCIFIALNVNQKLKGILSITFERQKSREKSQRHDLCANFIKHLSEKGRITCANNVGSLLDELESPASRARCDPSRPLTPKTLNTRQGLL